ncbi:protein of unknown function [endosymbiont DhMRE of Dentiscutata heterogama]|uniref:hypothetical protein n=1 Tax=endosymbiont DhMRE of Dentiscutata heterogama TaxID=1609546 RepID=UPI000637906D|nr:hypothetical protein [endosymbiont DhMRE of Dentiscutata heterogama]CFW92723.1 protein of unknown function [endosymbiont DhMRE of Dentiscutata heterogama]
MYFWDEKKQKLVKNCPSCKSTFIPNQGANCPFACSARKLESQHKEIAKKMISYCFPRKRAKVIFPTNTPLLSNNWKWGWTDGIKQIIYIPWYTLRSKKEFFETNPHEVGHITAFEKKFALTERKIIKKMYDLRDKYEVFLIEEYELINYYEEHQKIISKYRQWEGHDYNPWYLEYLAFHKKLINSPFKKYAYGRMEPNKYGFNEKGEGKYKPRGRKLSESGNQ